MFNVGGPEVFVILLVALIVLGPNKLPEAARQVGRAMAELRRISNGFQAELRSVLDETVKDEPTTRRDAVTMLQADSNDPPADDNGAEPDVLAARPDDESTMFLHAGDTDPSPDAYVDDDTDDAARALDAPEPDATLDAAGTPAPEPAASNGTNAAETAHGAEAANGSNGAGTPIPESSPTDAPRDELPAEPATLTAGDASADRHA